MESVISGFCPTPPSQFAASRTRARISSSGDAVGNAGRGGAQRRFDTFRHGREIGFPVERRKNGAAHQGSAAKPGENGAAEPLHGDAAPVHEPAGFPVDRQRRLVAELDALGLQARAKDNASLAVVQSPRSPPPAGGSPQQPSAKRDRNDRVASRGRRQAAASRSLTAVPNLPAIVG